MPDLLGAWALDAGDEDEAHAVEAHLWVCETCASEASGLRAVAGWLGTSNAAPPPPLLREVTLARARERRPPEAAAVCAAVRAVLKPQREAVMLAYYGGRTCPGRRRRPPDPRRDGEVPPLSLDHPGEHKTPGRRGG